MTLRGAAQTRIGRCRWNPAGSCSHPCWQPAASPVIATAPTPSVHWGRAGFPHQEPWRCEGPAAFTGNAAPCSPGQQRWASEPNPRCPLDGSAQMLNDESNFKNFFFLVSCSAHLSYAYKGFHTFFINATNNWRTSPALRFKQWV